MRSTTTCARPKRRSRRRRYDEAAARLSTALELGIADPRERARVQVELGYLLSETGRFSESDAILAASLDAATGLEERGIAARALVQRSGHRLYSDPEVDPEQIRTAAEVAIATFTQRGDSKGLALAQRLLGMALQRQGQIGAGCAALERALAHANSVGEPTTRRRVVMTLGGTLCLGPMPVADAMYRCAELLESSRDDPALEAVMTRFLALLLAMAARFDEALEHVRRSSLVLDEANQMTISWLYRGIAAEAKALAGDRAGAEQELESQWLWFRNSGDDAIDERGMNAAYKLANLYCDEQPLGRRR